MAAMKRPTLKISYNAPVSLTFALLALLAPGAGHVTDAGPPPTSSPSTAVPWPTPWPGSGLWATCWATADTPTTSPTWCSSWCWAPTWRSGSAAGTCCGPFCSPPRYPAQCSSSASPAPPCWGPRGIVFMMILLSSFGGVRNGVIPTTLILVAVFYLGGELWDAIFVNDNVSQLHPHHRRAVRHLPGLRPVPAGGEDNPPQAKKIDSQLIRGIGWLLFCAYGFCPEMSSGSATLSAALPVLRKERGEDVVWISPDAVIIAERPGEMFDKLRTFYERFVNESRGLGPGPLPGLWAGGVSDRREEIGDTPSAGALTFCRRIPANPLAFGVFAPRATYFSHGRKVGKSPLRG